MYCKYCGNILEGGDVYCSACGAPLNRVAPPQTSYAPHQGGAPAVRRNSFLALVFAVVALSMFVSDVLGWGSSFIFSYGFNYFFAFCFSIPALVLGIIGHVKKQKYGTLSMFLAIGAMVLFFNFVFA